MLKLLSRLIDRLAQPADVEFNGTDPLQHPALERMNQRELGDLPFPPAARRAGCTA